MSAILLVMLIYVLLFSKSPPTLKEINDDLKSRELKNKLEKVQREIKISDYLHQMKV